MMLDLLLISKHQGVLPHRMKHVCFLHYSKSQILAVSLYNSCVDGYVHLNEPMGLKQYLDTES